MCSRRIIGCWEGRHGSSLRKAGHPSLAPAVSLLFLFLFLSSPGKLKHCQTIVLSETHVQCAYTGHHIEQIAGNGTRDQITVQTDH